MERAGERCSKQKEQHIHRPQGNTKIGREEKQVPCSTAVSAEARQYPVVPREGGRQTTSYNSKVLKSGRPDPTQDIRTRVTSSTGGKGMSQTPRLPGAPKDWCGPRGRHQPSALVPRHTHGTPTEFCRTGSQKYVEHRTLIAVTSRET